MKRLIVFLIILVVISGAVGYTAGFTSGVNWSVNIGLHFLDLKGVQLEINEAELKQGIFQYKNNIGQCYNPLEV